MTKDFDKIWENDPVIRGASLPGLIVIFGLYKLGYDYWASQILGGFAAIALITVLTGGLPIYFSLFRDSRQGRRRHRFH